MYNPCRALKPFFVVFLLESEGKALVRVIEIGLNPAYIAKFYRTE